MNLAHKIKDGIVNGIRSFLRLEPADVSSFTVKEQFDFEGKAFLNRLWYRGDSYELEQMYRQLAGGLSDSFWGAVPTRGMELIKRHTGIPKLAVNTLAGIAARDFNGIEVSDRVQQEQWDDISEENRISDLILEAVEDMLVVGDGAFKISLDPAVSKLPIIEWYSGEKVRFHRRRGRVYEVEFLTEYRSEESSKCYFLHEYYGIGYVRYRLVCEGRECELSSLPETAGLTNVQFDGDFMLAVPLMMHKSKQFPGRGQSIFDGKLDAFDALDEAISQWWQAMRDSRPKTYFPERYIPRDPKNGGMMRPNPFDNSFVKVNSNMSEGANDRITVEQPAFPAADYNTTYCTALDLALEGIVSPSTLGIDVKKLDNAEAQREKEKVTLYTRNLIISVLTSALEKLAGAVLKTCAVMNKSAITDVEIKVKFGEYANPSFEAAVETLSNPSAPMSVEAKVDELWGDSKDEEWKKTEVQRIKEQTGVASVEEPSFGEFGGDE